MVAIDDKELVFADIPGLIEGAHSGKGLGTRFLGHVERCSALVHLIDATSENVTADYTIVLGELEKYGKMLTAKTIITVLSKIDALDRKVLNKQISKLSKLTDNVFAISAVSGEGMKDLLRRLNEIDSGSKEKIMSSNSSSPKWSP